MVIVMIDIHEVMKNKNDAIKSAVNEKIINDPMIIVCRADREVMLCEQVIRMCRGEASQFNYNGQWVDSRLNKVVIGNKYRAKPKKELFVPWEWIDEKYNVCVVDLNMQVGFKISEDSNSTNIGQAIKLDLEGIDLPVTVKRP